MTPPQSDTGQTIRVIAVTWTSTGLLRCLLSLHISETVQDGDSDTLRVVEKLPVTPFVIMGMDRTYHAHQFIFSFAFYFILFIPCGRLSWLLVSFLLYVKYTLSYCIAS